MHPEGQSKYHPKPFRRAPKVQILITTNWPMKAVRTMGSKRTLVLFVAWSSMDESDDNNYM